MITRLEMRYGIKPTDYVWGTLRNLALESQYEDGAVKVADLIKGCNLVSSSTVRRVIKHEYEAGDLEISPSVDSRGLKIAQYVKFPDWVQWR